MDSKSSYPFWLAKLSNKKRGTPKCASLSSSSASSEDELHSQSHRPDSSAEQLGVQEVRAADLRISGRRGCGDHTSCAEDIAVAQRVVGMVEHVEEFRTKLQDLGFGEVRILEFGEIQHPESGCVQAVSSQGGAGSGET